MSDTSPIPALLQLRRAVVETPDERFDYRTQERGYSPWVPPEMVDVITMGETLFIEGCRVWSISRGNSHRQMTTDEATGARGKSEACRRIDVVLQRHGYARIFGAAAADRRTSW
jgi:hypothetical protein